MRFFFIVLYKFFGDVDDVTRKPSITQPVHLHFGVRQETNEGEWKNKNKENCNLTWILNFSKIFEKKKSCAPTWRMTSFSALEDSTCHLEKKNIFLKTGYLKLREHWFVQLDEFQKVI
jgi:hypothetical protein